jgi:hypothetical protein
MKNCFAVFLFGVLLSCSIFQSSEKRELIAIGREFEDTLKVLWKYDSVEQHYIQDKKLFFQTLSVHNNKYSKYLKTKDTAYITKLFGRKFLISTDKNDKIGSNKILSYMFTKYPCVGACKDWKCDALHFYFNDEEKGKIKYVDFRKESCSQVQ